MIAAVEHGDQVLGHTIPAENVTKKHFGKRSDARQTVRPEARVKRHALDGHRRIALGEVAGERVIRLKDKSYFIAAPALPQYLCKDVVDEGERHKPLTNLSEGRHIRYYAKHMLAVTAVETTNDAHELIVCQQFCQRHAVAVQVVTIFQRETGGAYESSKCRLRASTNSCT